MFLSGQAVPYFDFSPVFLFFLFPIFFFYLSFLPLHVDVPINPHLDPRSRFDPTSWFPEEGKQTQKEPKLKKAKGLS